MAYRSFREFLSSLEKEGELKRITIPVDPDLLLAEWADREMKSPGGGKALLFERPIIDGTTSEFPVAINTMGSRRRMALALQVSDIADIAQEILLILKAKTPTDLRATSAFTGCKFMMSARRECTGNFTRSERAMVNAITSAVNGCRSQSRSAGTPFTHSPQPRRCQTVWTNFFSLGFCEGNQSSSSAAKRSISMCRQT